MTDAGPLTGGPYPLTVSQRDSDNNSMNYRHSFIILIREGEEGPEIRAPLVQTPPVLDGVLDDACWKGAFCCTGFYRPDWNKPATEQTFAYLCYDKENIYIGFYCKDSQPEKIYARETKRGGRIRRDDNVAVMLDVQHQHREQYSFRVTPRGCRPNRKGRLDCRDGHPVQDSAVSEGTEHIRYLLRSEPGTCR